MNRRLLLAMLGAVAVAAHADPAAERRRIGAERRAIEARFDQEEAACRERFVVTSCVDGVLARKRELLAGLRHQELLLDDADRKARAAARLEGIEAKRAAAAARPPAPPRAEPAPHRAAAPAAPQALRPARPEVDAAEAEAAARRASAAARRREAAAADRARIAAREAQREAGGKKSAPLPTPDKRP